MTIQVARLFVWKLTNTNNAQSRYKKNLHREQLTSGPFYEQVLLPLIYQSAFCKQWFTIPITPDGEKNEPFFRIETLQRTHPNRLGRLIFNAAERGANQLRA
jgi:hypothetical protein